MKIVSIPIIPEFGHYNISKNSIILGVVEYFGQPRMIVNIIDELEGVRSLITLLDGQECDGTYIASYVSGGALHHLIETTG